MLRRFLLVSLLFSVTAQAQAPRFDQLVAGNGVASRAFTGSDSGQGGTGLRLTSMGRLQAAEATVWRLRNASAQSRAVRLESVDSGFSLSLSLPAGTELTLRSPVNAGAATHRLYEGAALIDTKAAGSEVYTDATPTSPSAGTNRPPQFLSAPGLLADVDQTYRYAPIVYDPDNDLLSLSVSGAPSRYQYVAARNAFEYLPQRAEIGSYSAVIRANDGRGGNTPQSYTLRVVQDFCPIYPIAIPHSVVANAQVGANLTVARGQNAGNFSWLSWAGQNNAPTLAQSLMPPGDSYLYRNPNDSTDSVLSMGDWIQGAPGNMQANAVVTAINALMGRDIIVPSFDQTRGQGAGFDYRSVRFVTIRLSQYVGSGQGSLSFSYRGLANCYSDPEALAREPVALWSHANAQNFQWDGTENRIRGLVHGNQNITLNGSRNDFEGSVRYVTTQTGSGNENRYLRWPVQSSLQALPHTVDVASFAPGSPLANSLGTQYRDQSARCGQGKWDINQPATQLPTGVHYIPCDVDISANNWSGNVTIISTGRVTLGGGGYQLTPFHRAVSIATSSTHAQSIRFSGGTSRIDGLVYSRGGIELGTQGWTHGCAIIGDRIRLSGSQNKYFPTCELSSAPPPNRQPVAIDATVTVAEDGTVSITLQATDPDGDALSYSIVGQPGKGTLSGTGAARTYTPDANYHGTDSFTFKANDGTVDSNTATVSITVTPVNDAPVITSTAPTTATVGVAYSYQVLASDIDGDALSYSLENPPAGATISATGVVSWTPSAAQLGTQTLTIRVTDGTASVQQVVAVSVSPAPNRPPVASNATVTVAEDGTLSITLQATDPDGDALSYSIVSPPSHGTLSGTGVARTYTPDTNYHGTDSFTFRANDGTVDSNTATVSITVTPVNDAPTAQAQQLSTPRDVALPVALTAVDPDGDVLVFRVVQAPANGSLSGVGAALVYTPRAGFRGEDGFDFVANDGEVDSALARVRIDVIGGNEPPRIVSTPVTAVDEGQAYAYDVDALDPDGDVLRYELTRGPAGLQMVPDSGLLSGTPSGLTPQSLQSAHTACYIDVGQPVNPQPNEALKRLIWRTRAAIQNGSGFVAPEAEAWHRRNTCLGCHVQTIPLHTSLRNPYKLLI